MQQIITRRTNELMNEKESYFHPFPRRLRMLFDETRCSQQDVADYVGVTRQAVSQWKDGKTIPDCYNFKKIAEFFKVPLEYLYGDTDSRVKENQALADSLGFSDAAIAKLQTLASEPTFGIKPTALLSRLIDTDEFDRFLQQAQRASNDYVEIQCDLLDEDRIPPANPNDPAVAAVRRSLNAHATAIGHRIIPADDLTNYHRQQAMEAMGAAIKTAYERYFAENKERLIEEWYENFIRECQEQAAVAESLGVSLE